MEHILVLDLAEISLPLSAWPTQECTSTFTRQVDHALDVLRKSHPRRVLLNIEKCSAEVTDLLEEALSAGARVLVVSPLEPEFFALRTIDHPNLTLVNVPVDAATLRAFVGDRSSAEVPDLSRVHIHRQTKPVIQFGPLPSQCCAMREILDQLQRVASTSVPVMLIGESGTGKEIAAQEIHRQSHRKNKPFVPVNCGAISPQLIESELFGHEKGSFTGAVKEHRGVFEQAQGGTLFLDEITEMPVELQVKLLRVLETHKFFRVGSDGEQSSDVRIVAATNRCPEKEVEEGRLRADLLYRIQVFPIRLPPLRLREGDVEILAEHFLAELNREEASRKIFSSGALTALARYSWPGNIRELKNVVQRTYIMADHIITAQHLPSYIMEPAELVQRHGSSLKVRVGMSVAEVEKNLIVATLDQCNGKKEKAAGVLGVSVKTLYNRLREYEELNMSSPASPGYGTREGYN